MGLDVVKSRLEGLHGTIERRLRAGAGPGSRSSVPLTLTTLRVLLVAAGGQVFALASTQRPAARARRPGRPPHDQGRRECSCPGRPALPVALLADVLGLAAGEPAPAEAEAAGLIVAAGDRRMAFVVDELIAEQEIIVKGLGDRIRRRPALLGGDDPPRSATIALVLNAPD